MCKHCACVRAYLRVCMSVNLTEMYTIWYELELYFLTFTISMMYIYTGMYGMLCMVWYVIYQTLNIVISLDLKPALY